MIHAGWDIFPFFAGATLVAWIAAGFVHIRESRVPAASQEALRRWGTALHLTGALIPTLFALLLWISLGRPPLKTLGETRLWYAVFLPWIGLLVQARWGMRWLNHYCVAMAALFLLLNVLRPDAHDRTLMPALQSPWFVPHVIVYIVAFGLVFGGVWAKEAWGHYWTWDPKETWSLLTWMIYLVYLHVMHHRRPSARGSFLLLVAAFALLLTCWFGVNYLPSAATSVHTYSG
jgi:ABC-type transport system involved in cytochrome c biogenesis permease subunit